MGTGLGPLVGLLPNSSSASIIVLELVAHNVPGILNTPSFRLPGDCLLVSYWMETGRGEDTNPNENDSKIEDIFN